MDPPELARWTRFAAKGGIGKCTAVKDCIAENEGDLMFLKGDEITVLMQLDGQGEKYLGHCEGVVGSFSASDVRFHTKLKKPVMTKRVSTNPSTAPSPQPRSPTEDEPSSLPLPQAINLDGSIDQILALRNHIQERASMLPPQVTAPLNVPKKPPVSPPNAPESSSEPPPEPIEEQQQDQSYATYENPSTRLSDAYSDDGQVGIGLNMLQALVDDDDDDDDDTSSDASHYSNAFPQPPTAPAPPPEDKLKPPSTPTSPIRNTHDPAPRAPSLVPSVASSSSWEGAIYDDYRYSRYSMASKPSRFSTASSILSGQQQPQPPPLPVPDPKSSLDYRSRPSTDSDAVRAPPRMSSTAAKLPLRPPIPLSLQPNAQDHSPAQPSPLLHTNWGSPTSSTHPQEDAATADDKASTIEGPSEFDRQIVIEDNEDPPSAILSSDLHESPSSSPELAFDQEDEEEHEKAKAEDEGAALLTPDPPPNNDPSPASSKTPSPSPNQLRPSLADLRGIPIPGTNARQSLFLPHPNAPKPPSEAAGPMYLQTPQEREKRLSMAFSSLSPSSPSLNSSRPTPNAFPFPPPSPSRLNSVAAVKLALSKISQQRPPPPGLPNINRTTIYGRTDVDLLMSTCPVPIVFSVDPFPSPASQVHYRMPQPQRREEDMARAPPRSASLRLKKPSTTPASVPLAGNVGRVTITENPTPSTTTTTTSGAPAVTTTTAVAPAASPQRSLTNAEPIPRSNFFPKLPGARPRSRSFSAFDSGGTGGSNSGMNRRPDPAGPSDSLGNGLRRSSSSHNLKTLNGIPPPLAVGGKTSSHRPSPLLPHKNEDAEPLNSPVITVNNVSSPEVSSGSSPAALRIQTETALPSQLPHTPLSPVESSSEKLLARPSVDTDAASVNSDTRSFAPSVTGRRESLRSKLSLPNLRKHKTKQDETSSLVSTPEVDTVQVKDMDFELVRPNLPFLATLNEDLKKDGLLDPSGLPGSPALSTFSNRSPTAPSDHSAWPSPKPDSLPVKLPAESEQLLDAHRQRELKWVSLLSSVPPSQSRKTKKIRKLLLEGVPASVRYLVWTHVTNGRGRIVAGVYPQLCSRGSVAASNLIAAHIDRYFKQHPQLQGPESPVLTVLQAYLNMVPDVQYAIGLTLIMGQLLLQGPEEEVFWIFVSLMDSHLRPYFSINSIQLEVDATLFSRALEANDPQVAKKMLMDMSIAPEVICSSWFTSVFVDALPLQYVNRVWDIFMYEGIPFLIRVGLALVNCCRRQILECREERTLLELIRQPPQQLLPPHPDVLVTLSLNQKVKDDDVRKQRVKMEAQVKRQTQAQTVRKSTAASAISLPRTE